MKTYDYGEIERRALNESPEFTGDIYTEWARRYDLPRALVKSRVGMLFYSHQADMQSVEKVLVSMLPFLRAEAKMEEKR